MNAPNIAGQCINLGHDQPIAIRRLIELIETTAGVKATIQHHAPRSEDMPLTHADLTKARRLLSYETKVDIAAGVRDYVQWFRRGVVGS
jgi:UDP-glucuronate 4-epimerase